MAHCKKFWGRCQWFEPSLIIYVQKGNHVRPGIRRRAVFEIQKKYIYIIKPLLRNLKRNSSRNSYTMHDGCVGMPLINYLCVLDMKLCKSE